MSSPFKALDKLGPAGKQVVLFGVPAVAVLALVARSRGAGVSVVGGKESTGPQMIGAGVGPDAVANLGNYFTRLYGGLLDEVGAINARLDAGLVPQPTGQPTPAAALPVTVAPAPSTPAAQAPLIQLVAPQTYAKAVATVSAEPTATYREPEKVIVAQDKTVARYEQLYAEGKVTAQTLATVTARAEKRTAAAQAQKK